MLLVKVARVGEKIQQVAISDTAGVNEALIAAGRLPFENEDIWLNHQVVASTAGVRNGDTIILEPRQTTQSMRDFIDFLIREEVISDPEFLDDGNDDNIDYNRTYRYEKTFIDALIIKAKVA